MCDSDLIGKEDGHVQGGQEEALRSEANTFNCIICMMIRVHGSAYFVSSFCGLLRSEYA